MNCVGVWDVGDGYIYREEREGGTGLVRGKKKNWPLCVLFTNRPPKVVGTARAGFSLHG